jgi:4-amino-4-deoxy-L-arabinose transferase-like glycosyltransferase
MPPSPAIPPAPERAAPFTPRRGQGALVTILVAGLALRLALFYGFLGAQPTIADERDYIAIARNLLHEGRFASSSGALTSLRPPLYPAFLAGLWALSGRESLEIVRAAQILLGLATVALLYAIAFRLWGRRVAVFAAAGLSFYPSLLVFDFLILTEILFTFLLLLAVMGGIAVFSHGRPAMALFSGFALGLAALTRSVLWPFPAILCPLVAILAPGAIGRRLGLAALVFVGFALPVFPWAVRNTRIQKVPVGIDTMGGINLRLGNYEHTPDERMWDAIALTGEKSWAHGLPPAPPGGGAWTEGQKEKWAAHKALSFMWAHPFLTLRRAAIKFCDFWGIEREILAGLERGNFRPPRWAALLAALAIPLAYAIVALFAALGLFLAPPEDRRAHALFVAIVLFVTGVHTVVYGHSRYHLPLVPILLLYAAAALEGRSWRRLREGPRVAAAPLLVLLGLFAIWVRALALDAGRISRFFGAI